MRTSNPQSARIALANARQASRHPALHVLVVILVARTEGEGVAGDGSSSAFDDVKTLFQTVYFRGKRANLFVEGEEFCVNGFVLHEYRHAKGL